MRDTLTQNLGADGKTWTGIFDALHNGIIVVDRDGIVLFFNLAARRIFNETERSFIGRHFSEIRPETWPDLQEILKTGQPQIGKRIDLPRPASLPTARRL